MVKKINKERVKFWLLFLSLCLFCYLLFIIVRNASWEPFDNPSNSEEENTCSIVSSRGLLKSCKWHDPHPTSSSSTLYPIDTSQVKQGDTIYICNAAIRTFASDMLDNLPVGIVLVSGDSDDTIWESPFPDEAAFRCFIEHPRILHWFAQNAVSSHPKLTTMPIGLDLHSDQDKGGSNVDISTPARLMATMLDIRDKAKPLSERTCQAYANFQFLMTTKYGADRQEARDKIPAKCVFYEPSRIGRLPCYQHQSEYAFVVSPFGNGYDCHRTWEALILGCIPIVRSSGLDSLWEDLPVLVIDDWSEVTMDLLEKTLQEFAGRSFQFQKLTLAYWVQQFANYKI